MSAVKALEVNVLKVTAMFAVLFAVLLVFAVMPMRAQAASLTAEQVQAVTNLLVSFNVDTKTVDTVTMVLKGGTTGGDRMMPKDGMQNSGMGMNPGQGMGCGLLVRNLVRGAQGDDVAQLQAFLQKTGDLKATSTTNFFGPMTEEALKMWQKREGVVQNGDAQSTGFGMVGPMTRKMVLERCQMLKENRGEWKEQRPDMYPGASATSTPVCVLRANKNIVAPGESVVLSWESKNATYASTVSGGQGPVNGSITQTPTETTVYLKRVYNANGQGECSTTVTVGSTTPAAQPKVVVVPTLETISRTISLMGSGMAAVMDGYLSLFGLSLE
jgi:peptidoglycan hydrolase-like protein with peptidoglycan-binding domain